MEALKRGNPAPPPKLCGVRVRGLFLMLFDYGSNIWPARLTGVFHFLCIFSSGSLRGVSGSKTIILFQHGVARTVNFVKSRHGRLLLWAWRLELGKLLLGK